MRKILLAVAILALCAGQATAQNALKNPGFEDPTVDTGSSLGQWFRFKSDAGSSTESTAMPHGGARHISLETSGANQFAGVFQTLESQVVPGVNRPIVPGASITFTGWHKSVGVSNQTSEIKIEWTGAPQNRVDVLNVGPDWTQFTHTAVAPPLTTGATITYAISSFGPGQTSDVTVYVDDFQATVVPEPATAGGLALGLAALARFRRRK
jgi:hypothetical protein